MKKPSVYLEAKSGLLHGGEHVPAGTVIEVEEGSTAHVDMHTSGRTKASTREAFEACQRKAARAEKGGA